MIENSEASPEILLSQVLTTFSSTDVTITNFNYIIDLFLEYILREENNISQPEIILKWITGWLQNVSSIPWNAAHRVFHLISTIITQYNCFIHLEDIVWILNRTVQLNNEPDVNNRAELLKALMFTLSQEKLKKTFVQITDYNESNVSEISLNVTILRKAPINVAKLPYVATDSSNSEIKCAIEYLKYIEDVESKRPTAFKLLLTPSSSNEHDIQALVIMLAVAESCGSFEPIYIGHFKLEENQSIIFVQSHLEMPYPTVCNLRAEFAIRNRLMTCDLLPLHFTFSDFFRQLPIPEIQQSAIFPELWSLLLSKGAIQSFLSIELKQEDVKKKLSAKLAPFIVGKNDDESNGATCVAIYLPPGKHLLCQFKIEHSRTRVAILTESTYLLSCTNNFLNYL